MIIALSGPSGIGKGYVKKQLLRLYPCIQELEWFTTRPLRTNEQVGGNRTNVSVSEFRHMADVGELVLIQNLFGYRYGLRMEDLLPTDDIKLTELHPDNISKALKINPAIIAIGFVTFDISLLHKRLTVIRKTESLVEIEKRVAMAEGEIRTILQQKSLFTSVVEITEARKHTVIEEVLAILTPHLPERKIAVSLKTQVGSVNLKTPLLLASGYITETPEFFKKAQPYGCSGMVTRSLKQHVPPDRSKITVPRYAVFGQDNMLNCEWGNEKPWTEWRDGGVHQVKDTGCPIIVSLSGRDLESCCALVKAFDKLNVDAYEINISCSHSGALHGNLNIDVLHLEELMKKVRNITKTPIWIKLSYSNLLFSMAGRAQELGADAIVCTNSIGPGMLIDVKTARSKLGIKGGGGGMTGKAIFPIALWCVHRLSQNLTIPVVGCGGIFTADDVVQMLMAGASAVQLYTAPALKGPTVFKHITAGLQKFLAENPQYASLADLVGLTLDSTKEHHFSSPRPVVIEEKCTGCGICIQSCAFDALTMIRRADRELLAVIADNCISCNACVGVCPPKFDAIKASF